MKEIRRGKKMLEKNKRYPRGKLRRKINCTLQLKGKDLWSFQVKEVEVK